MFERKITSQLENWFNTKNNKKALIIKGLRQIGKTTTVKEFCKNHYKNVVYINFLFDHEVKEYFNDDLNVDKIIMLLSAKFTKVNFVPYETVLIFDEIQECANARTSLKPFVEDGRYDVIATGSMIGLRGYNQKQIRSIPVGFETIIEMKPMDFEEFLWATGVKKDVISYLKECFIKKEKINDSINKLMMDYFKEYICVGGLPDIVKTFVDTKNMKLVRDNQISLLNSFKDDFGKHLNENEEAIFNNTELQKIMEVYDSIPNQLAKENKKFVYNEIKKNAKSREYLSPIIWLEEYGLIHRCYRLNNLELPLSGYKEKDVFKIYVSDTGLFMAMLDEDVYSNILTDNLTVYKGAIYENVIADAFSKNYKKLYYYSKASGLELDFVTTYNNELTVIEVKAKNSKTKSLKEVLTNKDKYKVTSNFKLINGNIGFSDIINTIPLYMGFLIK